MNRSAVLFAVCSAACLCFSQAEAPQQLIDRLVGESPVIIGVKGAWMVQEPRVVHSGFARSMLFGPGKDEVVVSARDRVTVSADMFTNPSKAAGLANVGDRLSIINLVNGARRQITLPRNDLQVKSLVWRSNRIIEAIASSADWRAALLIDTTTGACVPFEGIEELSAIESDISHLALLVSSEEVNGNKKTFLKIVDFSVSPPSVKKIEAPDVAEEAFHLTKEQKLICSTGAFSAVELDLRDFSIRPWSGEIGSVSRSGMESSWAVGVRRPKRLEAIVRKGNEGGLWIEEALPPVSPGERGTPEESRPVGLKPRTRISRDADLAFINEGGTRLIFRALGAAFYSDIVEIDKEAVTQAMMAAARTKALSMAKQAGTANFIYASDYDDRLPFTGGQVENSLAPYMADPSFLKYMVWTNIYGQKLADIKDPSSFELGYLPGPGGRAVVFADGSVRWRAAP